MALRVATITQETCSSIHIATALSQVFALLLLKPGHSSRDELHWLSAMSEKVSSMASENDSVTFTVLPFYFVHVTTNSIHSLDHLDAFSSK